MQVLHAKRSELLLPDLSATILARRAIIIWYNAVGPSGVIHFRNLLDRRVHPLRDPGAGAG